MKCMNQLSDMMGVELCEEFQIKANGEIIRDSERDEPVTYYLMCGGMLICAQTKQPCYELFAQLLSDPDYEIVKLPWKPKLSELFWYVCEDGTVMDTTFRNTTSDLALVAAGWAFHTKEEADAAKPEILASMRKLLGEYA